MPGPRLELPPWWDALILGAKGRILPISANINAILRAEPAFAGRFGTHRRPASSAPAPYRRSDSCRLFPHDLREHRAGPQDLAGWFRR